MQKKRKFLISIGIISISLLFLYPFLSNFSITGLIIYQSASDGSTINDTYLREQFPNNNFGTATTLRVGNVSGGTQYNFLIKDTNISSINSDDTVVSAQLQIYINESFGNSNITLKVYRAAVSWTESEATWNNKTATAPWGTAGGDYTAELDSINITNESGNFYNFTITDTVQGWVNGTLTNYGLVITAPNTEAGNYTYIASSDETNTTQKIKIIIEHTPNAAPQVTNISTNSSPSSPIQVEDTVLFTINWTDIESNQGQTFVCNSNNINKSGCLNTTICNTSMESSGPSTCSYTTLVTDNTTTTFYTAVCDSNNCSTINQSNFYVNHNPSVNITLPNGGETINQSLGNYTITFNVSDPDSDTLTANLYYGETQNSTTNTIIENLNLTAACTDADSDTSTKNTCEYQWNSTDIYGTYYLTINLNDSYAITNDTSNSTFNVRSLIDNTAPNLTAQWIDSDIYSGQSIQIYANVTESYLYAVWASINTTPQTNLTMTNTTPTTFNTTWTATAAGSYEYKTYANDTTGNINNSMDWENFTIRSPTATTQNITAPSTALPYHVIKVTGQLNATEPLTNVYAYLNAPSEFTFLSNYSQNALLGNFTATQTKTATWFLSVPITESTYTLNITYTDEYSNSWDSSNAQVQVTSAVGGGYSVEVAGYPEVETSSNYYVEGYFKQSGSYTTPDSIQITIYDSTDSTIVGPTAMTLDSTGIYNYTYSVPAAPNEGQWETLINATKDSTSYFTHEFWKVVGGPFDVRDITIVNSNIDNLNISVVTENTGGANKDLTLAWNLTRTDTGALLHSGADTFMVPASSTRTWSISPTTTYIGQVKITFLGTYSGTEKAGAYTTFSTTDTSSCGDAVCNGTESCSTCPTDCGICATTTGGGGGGGGGGTTNTTTEEPTTQNQIEIQADSEIFLTKNIEKTLLLKIKNIDTTTLSNIKIEIEGLDNSIYTIDPKTIKTLKPQETKEIKLRLFITEIIENQNFNYLVTVNNKTYKKPAKILIFSTFEYFTKEKERLQQKISDIKNRTNKQETLNQLSTCEKIIELLNQNIQNQEFINAIDNIKKADECINNIENQLKKESKKTQKTMSFNTIILTISGIIILIILIIALFILYKIYRKLTTINIMQSLDKVKVPKETKDLPQKEKNFNEKIKNIEDKLNK